MKSTWKSKCISVNSRNINVIDMTSSILEQKLCLCYDIRRVALLTVTASLPCLRASASNISQYICQCAVYHTWLFAVLDASSMFLFVNRDLNVYINVLLRAPTCRPVLYLLHIIILTEYSRITVDCRDTFCYWNNSLLYGARYEIWAGNLHLWPRRIQKKTTTQLRTKKAFAESKAKIQNKRVFDVMH